MNNIQTYRKKRPFTNVWNKKDNKGHGRIYLSFIILDYF